MKKETYFKITPCCNKTTTNSECQSCDLLQIDLIKKSNRLLGTKANIKGRKVTVKGKHNTFKFKCTGCGGCCKQLKPQLSPYDVLILSKRLSMSMKEFIIKYTHTIIEDKLPTLYLTTKGQCPFLKDDKCSVYSDRPFTCRLYPLAVSSGKNGTYYYVWGQSPGLHNYNKRQTIQNFLDRNVGEDSNDINELWIKFERILARSKAPLKNKTFIDTLIRTLYSFDDPFISKRIENLTGKHSDDPKEQFYQMIDFVEQSLLKPYVTTIEQEDERNNTES